MSQTLPMIVVCAKLCKLVTDAPFVFEKSIVNSIGNSNSALCLAVEQCFLYRTQERIYIVELLLKYADITIKDSNNKIVQDMIDEQYSAALASNSVD